MKAKSWLGAVLVLGVLGAAFFLAFGKGCDEQPGGEVQAVKLDGKTFYLEVVDEENERMRGMGGRTHIDDNGGMLFVFPRAIDPRQSGGFVMRDCPVDIDIIFLDPTGRIVTMHQMKAEPPRGPGEGEPGTFDNPTYEARLTKYPSRYPYQFAIELKGGMLNSLKLAEGQKVDMPVDALKARVR